MVKSLPAVWEARVSSLGREYPLEKGMAPHSSFPAWRISQTEEPGGLKAMGLQRVGHDWASNTHHRGNTCGLHDVWKPEVWLHAFETILAASCYFTTHFAFYLFLLYAGDGLVPWWPPPSIWPSVRANTVGTHGVSLAAARPRCWAPVGDFPATASGRLVGLLSGLCCLSRWL